MRIFYAAITIIGSAVLWMLPISAAIYDFRTDPRTDTFDVTTAANVTTANVTLTAAIYSNDTGTISYTSNISETPALSTYNTTTRQLLTSGLTANANRSLAVTYDRSALATANAIDTLMDWWPYIWYLILTLFPIAAIAAIFTNRA